LGENEPREHNNSREREYGPIDVHGGTYLSFDPPQYAIRLTGIT
jgi:hypothetical protein